MKVGIESLLEGASRARGSVVVVDVFRAYTTAAVALTRGAEKIVLVAEPEEALALRERGVGGLCVGEVNGVRPDGFDFGNSPFDLSQEDLSGETLILSTRAGTMGVCALSQDPAEVEAVFVASLVVASATAEVLRRAAPERVTIVAMGDWGMDRTDEDEQCALYLRNRLEGRRPDPDALRRLVMAGSQSQKYDDPTLPHFQPGDREIALRIDSLNFAMPVIREDGLWVARRSSQT